jgi:hypothetical protein
LQWRFRATVFALFFLRYSELPYMTRPPNRSPLEHQRLLKLAREYRKQGYQVTLYPAPEDLPSPLAHCSLDLVARRDEKAIAAEVRTRESLTLNGPDDLRKLSESVKKIPGWEFELVITNPRKKAEG